MPATLPLAGEGLSGAMIEEMISATEKESGARAFDLREMFGLATEAEAVPVGDAQRGRNEPSASFTTMTGREEEIIAHQARLADLTIVPHPQAGEDVAAADALHAVLFDSGRPVLLAPVQPPQSIGKRIAIAWNGTAYAASALASVMPFVRQAEAVRVLTSEDYFRRGPSAAEVVEYISHHGVAAEVGEFRPIDRIVGAGMLAAAMDWGADLMSMGALLLVLAPAPADPGRHHPPRAGTRHPAGADEPLDVKGKASFCAQKEAKILL